MKKIIKKTAAKAAPPGKSVKPSKPAPKRQSAAATKRTSTRATGSPPSAENYQHDGQAVPQERRILWHITSDQLKERLSLHDGQVVWKRVEGVNQQAVAS